jgi:hypothetical protein
LKRWLPFVVSGLMLACSGAPETAARNRTFYDWAVATGTDTTGAFEQRYPPLDLGEKPPNPEYLGYTVLRNGVHLSRPKNWTMRDGSNVPGQAFIRYISPNAYSFAIHERPESPRELWRDVLNRYEDDVESVGAKIVGGRVPMATWNGQARAFTVERSVEAPKKPLVSRSREILVRGQTRMVLVQIVFDSEDLSAVDHELMRAVTTLEVL